MKSFRLIGVELGKMKLFEDLTLEIETPDAGESLLRPLELTDLLLKPFGVVSLECAFHEFLIGA